MPAIKTSLTTDRLRVRERVLTGARGSAAAHRLAVLTAATTFLLLLSGGSVTSSDAGMADPQWPTPPWYLVGLAFMGRLLERGLGFLIEHNHREWGYTVGLLTILLCGWLWWKHPSRRLRWMGVVALAGVSLQGILGGLRVRLHAVAGPELAIVHGCVAQAFFGWIVAMAWATSPRRLAPSTPTDAEAAPLSRLGVMTVILVYLQLIVGALLRHTGMMWALYFHLLLAAAVTAYAIMLARRIRHRWGAEGPSGWARTLTILIVLQLLFGAAAWATSNGFGNQAFSPASGIHILIATSHVGVGALILAACVILTLEASQRRQPSHEMTPVLAPEGAA